MYSDIYSSCPAYHIFNTPTGLSAFLQSIMWFSVVKYVTVNFSLERQSDRIHHFIRSPAQLFACTLYSVQGKKKKKPLERLFVTVLMRGEETRSATPQDKQEIPSVDQVSAVQRILPTWPEEWPLSPRLTCALIPFVTDQKCRETSLPAAYFHFK